MTAISDVKHHLWSAKNGAFARAHNPTDWKVKTPDLGNPDLWRRVCSDGQRFYVLFEHCAYYLDSEAVERCKACKPPVDTPEDRARRVIEFTTLLAVSELPYIRGKDYNGRTPTDWRVKLPRAMVMGKEPWRRVYIGQHGHYIWLQGQDWFFDNAANRQFMEKGNEQ